jgi:hypothetical protein
MSDDATRDGPTPAQGAATSGSGTPVPVDMSLDRRARIAIMVFLAGPVLWALHFAVVYLVAEAGCTGDGTGLRLFDPPVPTVVTTVATVVGALACLACAWWAHQRWRTARRGPPADATLEQEELEGEDPGGTLEFAGVLLSLVSFVSILMVGLPALALTPC